MPLEQSRTLLYKLLGKEYAKPNPDQLKAVDEICRFVDGHPLAIIFASNLIRRCMMSFQQASQTLEKSRQLLVEWKADCGETDATLAATLEASISRLPKPALHMLQIMAFLDPDRIEESFLRGVQVPGGTIEDYSSYMVVLSNLSDHSLISRHGSRFWIHRIVQDVVIQLMDPESRLTTFSTDVDAIWAAFPEQTNGLLMSSVLDICDSCSPHVEALERRYKEYFEMGDGHTSRETVLHFAQVLYTCSW